MPVVETGLDAVRQVLADHPEPITVACRFAAAGAEGAGHNHPHGRSTFVRSERFRFTIDDGTSEVGPGERSVVPSGAAHGCGCVVPGTPADCFTPRRDDFL